MFNYILLYLILKPYIACAKLIHHNGVANKVEKKPSFVQLRGTPWQQHIDWLQKQPPSEPVTAYIPALFPSPDATEELGEEVKAVWDELEKQGGEVQPIKVSNLMELKQVAEEDLANNIIGTSNWQFDYSIAEWYFPYRSASDEKPDSETEMLTNATVTFADTTNIPSVKLEGGFLGDASNLPVTVEEGINYAAKIVVTGGVVDKERFIFVPGVKTYDIAGMTGDAHASERQNPSCAKMLMALVTAVVAIFRASGDPGLAEVVFSSNYHVFQVAHGRWTLATYMWDQIYKAFMGEERISYAKFVQEILPSVQAKPCQNEEVVGGTVTTQGACHNHMNTYMNELSPPPEFYAKICKDLQKRLDEDLWKLQNLPSMCPPPPALRSLSGCSEEECNTLRAWAFANSRLSNVSSVQWFSQFR